MKNRKNLIATIILTLLVIILLFPLFVLINSSLKTYEELLIWPPQWFNTFRFENYKEVITGNKSIIFPFINTLQISFIVMIISILIGTLAAYAVTRYDFKFKKLFLITILVTQMFSSVILVNPMYVIFMNIGLLDTKLALIIALIATSLPMTIWLLHSYFSQIPIDFEYAAWMDGASRLQGIKDIIFPLAIPGIVTAGLFSFIVSWGDLIFAKSFITDPNLRTISLALINFKDLYMTPWQTQMAASVITTIPPFILFMIIQKYIVKSMTSQGVKG